MTYQEIINRLGGLDLRLAEKEDYAAVYLAIEIIKEVEKERIQKERDRNE